MTYLVDERYIVCGRLNDASKYPQRSVEFGLFYVLSCAGKWLVFTGGSTARKDCSSARWPVCGFCSR